LLKEKATLFKTTKIKKLKGVLLQAVALAFLLCACTVALMGTLQTNSLK
jgi:hypothetical protein